MLMGSRKKVQKKKGKVKDVSDDFDDLVENANDDGCGLSRKYAIDIIRLIKCHSKPLNKVATEFIEIFKERCSLVVGMALLAIYDDLAATDDVATKIVTVYLIYRVRDIEVALRRRSSGGADDILGHPFMSFFLNLVDSKVVDEICVPYRLPTGIERSVVLRILNGKTAEFAAMSANDLVASGTMNDLGCEDSEELQDKAASNAPTNPSTSKDQESARAESSPLSAVSTPQQDLSKEQFEEFMKRLLDGKSLTIMRIVQGMDVTVQCMEVVTRLYQYRPELPREPLNDYVRYCVRYCLDATPSSNLNRVVRLVAITLKNLLKSGSISASELSLELREFGVRFCQHPDTTFLFNTVGLAQLKDSGETAANTEMVQQTSQTEIESSKKLLIKLGLIVGDGKLQSTFRQSYLRSIMLGAQKCAKINSVEVEAKRRQNEKELGKKAAERWECILRYLALPSDKNMNSVSSTTRELFSAAGFTSDSDGSSDLEITSAGFQFLLLSPVHQLWTYMIGSDFSQTAFEINSNWTEEQTTLIMHMRELGLIFIRKRKDGLCYMFWKLRSEKRIVECHRRPIERETSSSQLGVDFRFRAAFQFFPPEFRGGKEFRNLHIQLASIIELSTSKMLLQSSEELVVRRSEVWRARTFLAHGVGQALELGSVDRCCDYALTIQQIPVSKACLLSPTEGRTRSIFERDISGLEALISTGHCGIVNDFLLECSANVGDCTPCGMESQKFVVDDRSWDAAAYR
ncbi:unnamed protein product [Heligmosomoides polygyrus]|uniref:General transcription factor IIH subunit 4 n=1 Tax=Heligmosomoides polygyrus TaxID=6339 RepID=A0A183FRB6_HELPZ|nr:unnamed protein product [Heligmosomoides polygyrus]